MSGGTGGCAPEFESELDFEAGDESQSLAKNDEAPIEAASTSESDRDHAVRTVVS